MKAGVILKRTKRTAEAIGMLLAGLVVIWFILGIGGAFEDTWFDLPGGDEPAEGAVTNETGAVSEETEAE